MRHPHESQQPEANGQQEPPSPRHANDNPPPPLLTLTSPRLPQENSGQASPAPTPQQSLPSLQGIFTPHIPVVSHVPTRFRPALGDVFSRTLHDGARACETGQNDGVDKLTKVFFFPAVMLCHPGNQDFSGNAEARSHSNGEIFRQRMQLWRAGQYQTLWQAGLALSTRRASKTLTPSEQKQGNIRRALSLAKEGAYGKAAQALGSLGALPATQSVSDALHAKHPQETPDSQRDKFVQADGLSPFTKITTEQVIRAVRSLKPGVAPGGSGLRPSHLDEVLRDPPSSSRGGMRNSLTELVNDLAAGKAPVALAPWIAGAPLTPLAKKDMTSCPIAVGETLRRIVSSCLMSKTCRKVAEYFQPLQVGIATSAGADAIVQSIRRMTHLVGRNPEFASICRLEERLQLMQSFCLPRGNSESFPPVATLGTVLLQQRSCISEDRVGHFTQRHRYSTGLPTWRITVRSGSPEADKASLASEHVVRLLIELGNTRALSLFNVELEGSQIFCSKNTPPQKKLTDAVHKAVYDKLPEVDARTRAFRASMTLPGAKSWVHCIPSAVLKTAISTRNFSICFQYYCQIPLFAPGTPCPRASCPETMDIHRDHLIHCRYGRQRIDRHDDEVCLLASDLGLAARHHAIESRPPGEHGTRRDIRTTGATGGTDCFEVTFVNPSPPLIGESEVLTPSQA